MHESQVRKPDIIFFPQKLVQHQESWSSLINDRKYIKAIHKANTQLRVEHKSGGQVLALHVAGPVQSPAPHILLREGGKEEGKENGWEDGQTQSDSVHSTKKPDNQIIQ